MASQRSYEILIYPDNAQIALLDQFALRWNTVQRKLYKSMRRNPNVDLNAEKRNCIANEGLSGRHFNSIRDDLKGKIASVLELNKTYLEDAKTRFKSSIKTRKSLNSQIEKLNEYIDSTKIELLKIKFKKQLTNKQN